MNQSTIDRGLFCSVYHRSYMDLEKRSGVTPLEEFEKLTREMTLRMKHGAYDKPEDDSLVVPGTYITAEGIIIRKMALCHETMRNLGSGLAHTADDTSLCH